MTKRERKREYNLVHRISKLICATINTVLFISIFDISHPIIFFIANITYFFGVNGISLIIEKILHMRKKHDWL